MRHLVPGQLDPSQVQSLTSQGAQCFSGTKGTPPPPPAALEPRPCLGPQVGGAAVGGGAAAEPDTVGMLKQGHQSHRDLNLSKLALQSEDRRHGRRFHISPDNTASALR